MKLHETLKKVYDSITKLKHIEVLSDDGWQEVDSLNIGPKQQLIVVQTQHNEIVCTSDHILIRDDGSEIFAKDSCGKKIRSANRQAEEVKAVLPCCTKAKTYDLSLHDGTTHTYFTNGLLSHNCVILDEFAFLQKSIADKLFTSMYPVISSSKNGKFILVSTPNGTDNLYYDIWCQANSKEVGKNLEGWKPFEMHWYQVPGHDEEWKKKQIAAIGAQRFAQEFDNQFLAKGNDKKLIPDEAISRFRMKLSEYKAAGVKPKKQRIISQNEDELYEFEMWHEFRPDRTYLASADISEGIGADSSVLYVWDVTDLRNITMCAKFSSNVTSLVQFAYVVRKILALYNDPWLAAERNGVSAGMLDSLRITYGYQYIIIDNKKREPGIYSHIQVKSRACLWAREMLTTDVFGFTIYDKDLVDEMAIFIKKDTKGVQNVYHAMPGPNAHDDHIMTFIWCLYILNNERIQDYFIVCQDVTTSIGQVYAQILQPLNEYTIGDIDKVKGDPLYKEFMEYKEEAMKLNKQALDIEQASEQYETFKYKKPDAYFGDDGGDDWNNTPVDWNMRGGQRQTIRPISLNSGLKPPPFFVF